MIKYCIVIIFFCLGLNGLYCQTEVLHFNTSDGLQNDVTYNILQDSKGYIWIGTDDGLTKFDGLTFRNYSLENGLTSSYVTDIKEVSSGKFALATWGGGLQFIKGDSIYKSENFDDASVKMYSIQFHKNKLYAKTGYYFLVYDLEKQQLFRKVFIKNKGFVKDASKNESIGLLKLSIIDDVKYLHDQNSYKNDVLGVLELGDNFKTKKVFPALKNYKIGTIHKIREKLFLLGVGNQLFYFDGKGVTDKIVIQDIPDDDTIIKIIEGTSNVVFLIAQTRLGYKTIYQFNLATKQSKNIVKELSIKTTISDAMIDFEDNLWITTFGDGLYQYKYNSPKIKSFLNGKSIVDLLKYNNHIYALSPSKLFKFNKNSELLKTFEINGFAKRLSIINNKLQVSFLNGQNSNMNTVAFNLSNGTFFEKLNQGIIRQNDTIFFNKKIITVTNEIAVRQVTETIDTIHFFTNKGKWNYLIKKQKFKKDETFNLRLNTKRINDILIVGDSTYFATDRGLEFINNNMSTTFNESNGLQNERINALTYADNKIYAATQSGFSVIENNEILNFSKSFGLQSSSINKIIKVNNQLWLAGNNGISIVNQKDIKQSTSPKLSVNFKNLIIKYNAISFIHDGSISIQYKVNNNNWIELSKLNGVLSFQDYKSGNYNIVFRAKNGNSKWVISDYFRFNVKPPWYKVWWVILLLIIATSGIVAIIFNYRLKVESKRNFELQNEISKRIIAEKKLTEVRDNIARDFHDDLGNKLASISLLSDILSKKMDTKKSALVNTIKEDANYLYKGTKDFIFSLQEKSNYLEELVMYLTDFTEDYLFQFGIDFEVNSSVEKNIKLPHYWSKQIIYIFKEAITNSVKHANATTVFMSFECVKDNLIILCSDDGKGFLEDNVVKNGLQNMYERAKKIDCNLMINSEKNIGTKIIFEGKLP